MFGRMDKAAYSIAKKALSLVNVEYKFHDFQATIAAVNETAEIFQISNIPQGDTDQSRDGAQVKLTRVNIKYFLEANPAVANTLVRIMLVLDKQTNQAIYTIADLLADVTLNDGIVSMTNLDNKYRFRILYNKVHTYSNASKEVSYHEINKKLDMKLRYDASTPNISDLTSYSLSLVAISSQSTNQPTITFFSRLRFIDN